MCPSCNYQIAPQWFFCPNCGKVLKEKPFQVSFLKQISIYMVSFFLAPLGLMWGIKYIRSQDRKIKIIGTISILLTVLSVVLTITFFKRFIDGYANSLNNLNTIHSIEDIKF